MYIVGKYIYKAFIVFFVYILSTVAIAPNYTEKLHTERCVNTERFYGTEESFDVAALISSHAEAVNARLSLIESAHESIDISQFYINNDNIGTLFLGQIIKAADKGVKVRIIIDGKYHHVSGLDQKLLSLINQEPNIEIRLFEPVNILKPWTGNNLLHDKLLIIDKKQALVSGRNIGDRYLIENVKNFVYDLDTIVTYTGPDNEYHNSVLNEINDYFESVWRSPYVTKPKELKNHDDFKWKETVLNSYAEVKDKHPKWFSHSFNARETSVQTSKITLITNPLNRLKEPLVWCEIAGLINQAEEEVYINSPYVVPTKDIETFLDINDNIDIKIITNSPGTTPNYLGYSGYLRYKEVLLNQPNLALYEYQGQGSLHSKSYLIDNRISVVGSYNLDPRSTYLSTEIMLVIDSYEFAEQLKAVYSDYLNKSLKANGLYTYEEGKIKPYPLPKSKRLTLDLMRQAAKIIDHLL